jgi:hypothetical protein
LGYFFEGRISHIFLVNAENDQINSFAKYTQRDSKLSRQDGVKAPGID